MTITLDPQDGFALAGRFAEDIHFAVTSGRLARVGLCPRSDCDRERMRQIRASVASIPDAWERRQFVWSIRWHFADIRKEKGKEPRWQDYVAKVEAANRRSAA